MALSDMYYPQGIRKKVEVINGKGNGHAADRMYVVRSDPPLPDPYRALNLSKTSTSRKPTSNSDYSFFGGWQLKRRKRYAKYQLYAIEGRVKDSFKDFKDWCSRLVHGVQRETESEKFTLGFLCMHGFYELLCFPSLSFSFQFFYPFSSKEFLGFLRLLNYCCKTPFYSRLF